MPRISLLGSLLLCSILSPQILAADSRFDKVNITPIKLSEHSYMFSGAGGNIGVSVGKDGIVIIDDQFAPLADKISAALAKIQQGQPKYIINTHFHGDHTGGNNHFGQQGTILAHHNVLKRLSNDENFLPQGLPSITYDQGINIHVNGDTLKLIHLGPGHTDGDSVVLWSDLSVVHMGDLFFKDHFPFIDLASGGSVLGYRDSVTTVLQQIDDKTKVIPGHGELASKVDLLRFKQMLDISITWMTEELKANKTLDELLAQGVPASLQGWGWSFIPDERWIKTLYSGLSTGHQTSP